MLTKDEQRPAALGKLLRESNPRAVDYVTDALRSTGGNVSVAAKKLGVSRSVLHSWLDLECLADAPRLGVLGAMARARGARWGT